MYSASTEDSLLELRIFPSTLSSINPRNLKICEWVTVTHLPTAYLHKSPRSSVTDFSLDSDYTFHKIFANTLKHKRELLFLTLVLCLIISCYCLKCENSVQMFTGWDPRKRILKIQNINSYLSLQTSSSVPSVLCRSTRAALSIRNVWSAFEYLSSSFREKQDLPACWLAGRGSLP